MHECIALVLPFWLSLCKSDVCISLCAWVWLVMYVSVDVGWV